MRLTVAEVVSVDEEGVEHLEVVRLAAPVGTCVTHRDHPQRHHNTIRPPDWVGLGIQSVCGARPDRSRERSKRMARRTNNQQRALAKQRTQKAQAPMINSDENKHGTANSTGTASLKVHEVRGLRLPPQHVLDLRRANKQGSKES